MSNLSKDIMMKWIEKSFEEDSDNLLSSDRGNQLTVIKYLKEVHGVHLDKNLVSKISAVTRCRNLYLEQNPMLDKRSTCRGKRTPIETEV